MCGGLIGCGDNKVLGMVCGDNRECGGSRRCGDKRVFGDNRVCGDNRQLNPMQIYCSKQQGPIHVFI